MENIRDDFDLLKRNQWKSHLLKNIALTLKERKEDAYFLMKILKNEVELTGCENFRINSFLATIDTLVAHFKYSGVNIWRN